MGLAFVVLALVVYVASNPSRADFYDHFVWQAQAFLEGRAAITWPVTEGPFQNGWFQDVMPVEGSPGYGLLPFPPLPAIVLLPFVAVYGLATNGAMVAAGLGAINAGLTWRMLLRVTQRRAVAALVTVFYAFGTVAWYAAMLGSTWFLAHVVASTCLILAITAALDGDPGTHARLAAVASRATRAGDAAWRQLAAGILFGLAATARLTVIFGAPFFVLVGGGGSILRRAVLAGLGAAVPVALLLGYNLATTGHLLHPAYDYLYQVEYRPVPALVNPAWAIEDPRYVPQNAFVMLAWPPQTPLATDPACAGGTAPTGLGLLFDRDCPVLRPDRLGMSILLTSPAYLLALPALLAWRRRIVAGAALAIGAIALLNLMHFSQGWVQFGYRFSNDFAPFAMLLAAIGTARLGVRPVAVALVAASVIVNAWGVWWGVTLGW